jgi:hypothetical protein
VVVCLSHHGVVGVVRQGITSEKWIVSSDMYILHSTMNHLYTDAGPVRNENNEIKSYILYMLLLCFIPAPRQTSDSDFVLTLYNVVPCMSLYRGLTSDLMSDKQYNFNMQIDMHKK